MVCSRPRRSTLSHSTTPTDPVCPIFQILTKDSVTVSVDAIMYYKVSNAISAISNVDDYGQSTRLLAATTLRFEFTFRRQSLVRPYSISRRPFQKRVGHKKSGGYPVGTRVHRLHDAVDARRGDRSVGRQGREGGSVSSPDIDSETEREGGRESKAPYLDRLPLDNTSTLLYIQMHVNRM